MAEKVISKEELLDVSDSVKVAQTDKYIESSAKQRKKWDRHCYTNNFFYDGRHFRFLSGKTGRIVDYAQKSTLANPRRSIPKTTKQLRGIANLLLANDPRWVIYPEQPKEATGKALTKAWEKAEEIGRRHAHYGEDCFDKLGMREKEAELVINFLKHPVSYLQITYDDINEALVAEPYDFFDLYLSDGSLNDLSKQAYIGKAIPKTISELQANENYSNTEKLSAEGRYAESKMKEAYVKASFGARSEDEVKTVILKEMWIKFFLTENLMGRIAQTSPKVLEGKEVGDPIFLVRSTAGKQLLREEWVDLPDYPFVAFRFQPGALYQPAPIRMFMDTNRALDLIVSRIERWAFRMAKGSWLVHQNETIKTITDESGEIIKWKAIKPEQGKIAPLPEGIFAHIGFLEKDLEESGVSTAALGRIPKGVKAWRAIESLKAADYANLKVPIMMFDASLSKVAEKIFDLTDRYIAKPTTVYRMDQGKPDYFDIIGRGNVETYKEIGQPLGEGVIPIGKDTKVKIEIESGLSHTEEGKREMILQLAEKGFLPKETVLEELKVGGNVADILEKLEAEQGKGMAPEQFAQMKEALLSVIVDLKRQAEGGLQQPARGGEPSA